MKKFLTFEQVRQMWKVGPDKAKAHLLLHGISTKRKGQFRSIPREEVEKLSPPDKSRKTLKDGWEPTQEQIRQSCLEIQSRWTEEIRASRYVGPTEAMEMLAYRFTCGRTGKCFFEERLA